jgi:hypothetical protein
MEAGWLKLVQIRLRWIEPGRRRTEIGEKIQPQNGALCFTFAAPKWIQDACP